MVMNVVRILVRLVVVFGYSVVFIMIILSVIDYDVDLLSKWVLVFVGC